MIADLTTFCALPSDTLAAAASAIERLNPTIKRAVIKAALTENIGSEDAAAAVERLVFALSSLQRRGQGGATPDILAALQQALEEDQRSLLDSWDERRSYITRMLLATPVMLTAKAVHLSYDFARLALGSRIVTDIRPVFNEPREDIIGATITQTLRLDYMSSDGTESTLSVTLDMPDLRHLLKECQKALDKGTISRQRLEEAGLEAIIPGEDEPT